MPSPIRFSTHRAGVPVPSHPAALPLAIALLAALPRPALAAPLVPLPAGKPAAVEKHLAPLPPDEELKTIQLPDGYHLELVLAEPDIREPMAIAFDGDGRLYVVEMRTYMQDIEGTGELESRSRVSRHESTARDGRFDRHTVFADHLKIPRMVLPLQDEVLIGTTDTNDILAWRDADGDGTAETHRVFYEGGPRGGNMEHQPSGLLWAMDNWLYTTYNAYRLRWSPDGKTLKDPTAASGAWPRTTGVGHGSAMPAARSASGISRPTSPTAPSTSRPSGPTIGRRSGRPSGWATSKGGPAVCVRTER